MKKRVNISIGHELHQRAVAHAKSREMDFSELLAFLLRRELDGPSCIPPIETPKPKPAEKAWPQVPKERTPEEIRYEQEAIARFMPAPPLPAKPDLPAKPGRNERCPCGSGQKFKRCCVVTWPVLRKAIESDSGGLTPA